MNKNCSFFKQKCENWKIYTIDYCFECDLFPCKIHEKYSKKYEKRNGYNFLESLFLIKMNGADWFIAEEEKKLKCAKCGETICIHNKLCYSCNRNKLVE
jgi:hypothetical protein